MTAYVLALVSFQGTVSIGHFQNLMECEVQRQVQSDRGEYLKCLVYIQEQYE